MIDYDKLVNAIDEYRKKGNQKFLNMKGLTNN